MEELYQLIEERLFQIKAAYYKFPSLISPGDYFTADIATDSASDLRELPQYMSQIKRLEKIRVFKENELMETFFALKSFEPSQKKRFHEKSYYFMKLMKSDFCYIKYKPSEENKDVAKLYLNYFLATNMQNRIEELRRAYASTKTVGHSFTFVLVKWLVEITRTLFQVLLKARHKDNQGFPIRDEKAEVNSGTNTVVKRINIFRSRSACKQRSQSAFKENSSKKQESPMEIIGNKPSENLVDQAMKFINLSPVKGKHQDEICNEGHFSVINLNENGESCISDHRMKNNYEDISIFDPNITDSQTNIGIIYSFGKSSKWTPIIHRIQGSSVQLLVQNSFQLNNHLGLVEDLDLMHGTFNSRSSDKNQKKIKSGSLINIDLDRRKEIMNQVYKNLYAKNLDVEKTINNYNNQLFQKNMTSHSHAANPKKGENYCENLVLDFPKMFPHMIPDETGDPEISPKKATVSTGRKSISPTRPRRGTTEKKSSAAATPKVSKSIKPIRAESSHSRTQRTKGMDAIGFKTQGRFMDNEELSNSMTLTSIQVFKTENRFRIMKKKMGISHDLKPGEPPKSTKYENKLLTDASTVFPKEGNSQLQVDPGLYFPRSYKELGLETLSKFSTQTKELNLGSYSIYNRSKSISVSKVRSGQLIDYTIGESQNQARTPSPEKTRDPATHKYEQFKLFHAMEFQSIPSLNEG